MKTVKGDLFALRGPRRVIVIPTNGTLQVREPVAIMGAGVAKEAAEIWPQLPMCLGTEILRNGNLVHRFIFKTNFCEEYVAAFPAKDDWRKPARLDLIEQSAKALAELIKTMPQDFKVYLPRVGCGLGGLKWEQVRQILERYFDDQFVVVEQG